MEEILFGSVWNMVSLLLTTDDVDGIRGFGLHPHQEETLPDEQGKVDVTSLRDTLPAASSGNQTADAQGHRDEITGDAPGFADDNVSISIRSLSPDLGTGVQSGLATVMLLRGPTRRR